MANSENQNQFHEEMKTITVSLDNLPNDIIQNIFNFLSIKYAIVASTVSTRYKRSWRHSHELLFDRELYVRYGQQNLASIVDHLFNLHESDKIKTFKLHINPFGIEVLLNNWLQICTRKDLEDLELHLYRSGFTIEFNVFNSLHKLKTLKLIKCAIQLSNVPTGLQFLQTLSLSFVSITEYMFDVLITHCKMLAIIDLINCTTIKKLNLIARENKHLKKLRIANCHNLKEIEIDSPTLQSIFYHGKYSKVKIAQGMQLYEASFYFKLFRSYMKPTQLEALVKDLSYVSILTTTPLLIEGVAARMRDGVFREAQYCFVNLRELQIFMDGGSFCNPHDITMFLKSCPSMVNLFIDLNDYQFDLGMYWEIYQKPLLDKCNHKFPQLKVVVLRSFKFLSSELELVKIILQRAVILEKFFLIPPRINSSGCNFKIKDTPKYENIFGTWKASTKAIVKFHENYDDESFVNPTHRRGWFTDEI